MKKARQIVDEMFKTETLSDEELNKIKIPLKLVINLMEKYKSQKTFKNIKMHPYDVGRYRGLSK